MRRTLERSSSGNDDSYLLWVIRFFLEFNRLDGFKLPLVRWVLSVCPCQGSYLNFVLLISNNCSLSFVWCVCLRLNSEALSSTNYHWVLGRIQHHLDMLTSDKKNAKLWERRLNIAIQVRKSRILRRIVWMNDKWKIIVNVSFVCLPFRRWRSSFKISLHCKRCRVKMHSHYSKCCCTMCATFWNSVKRCSIHWRATMKIATQSNSTPQRTSIQFVWFYPPSPSPSLFFLDEFNWFHYLNLLSVCLCLFVSHSHSLSLCLLSNQNRLYMRDVVETAHIFFKLMERFCNGSVVVQDKQKSRKKNKRASKKPSKRNAQTSNNAERVSVFFFSHIV